MGGRKSERYNLSCMRKKRYRDDIIVVGILVGADNVDLRRSC